jgi:membrane-associated phospholipid phosphatase
MIWRHPGVPALLVTYGTSNDFFFSGHTAIAVLGAIELSLGNAPWLAGAAALVAVLEAVLVIILRAHYTMDVFAAAFAAWGCEALAGRLAPYLDGWLRHFS